MTDSALTREQVENIELFVKAEGERAVHILSADVLNLTASHEALRLTLAQQAQEIERLKDRNRNLMDVLRAIASMKITEADRMQQWAKDGLSGFVEPIESTVLKLTDQLAATTTERDKCKEISDWFGNLVRRASIGTKETPSLRAYIEQTEAKLSARDLSLDGSRAEVAALEQQLTASMARVKELEEKVQRIYDSYRPNGAHY